MDSLEEFEKSLAAEKAKRELEAESINNKQDRKHKHHHRRRAGSRERDRSRDRSREKDGGHRHRRTRDDDVGDEGHREKRSRHYKDAKETDKRSGHRHRHRHRDEDGSQHRDRRDREGEGKGEGKEEYPEIAAISHEEVEFSGNITQSNAPLVRDSWMTAPSALDVDYIHRKSKEKNPSSNTEEPQRIIHKNELNTSLGATSLDKNSTGPEGESRDEPTYKFGDEGSQWRMTKLKGVYTLAEQTGRPVDEIAIERFGSLRDFDDVREERDEMERRRLYGAGFVGKEKPTGEIYKERMAKAAASRKNREFMETEMREQAVFSEQTMAPPPVLDRTSLNRLKAQLMKAEMRKDPNLATLEAEYNAAVAASESGDVAKSQIVLDASHSRMLAGSRGEVKAVDTTRGRDRGLVEANDDMTIDDMVREERRTRGQAGGEGMRLAERIAKDTKFDDDLEYLDENAEKLAKRVHKSETNLKNVAISEFKKMNRVLDNCPLCHHEDRNPPQDLPTAPMIALGTRVFLTIATEPELSGAEGGAVIVPINHHTNLLECDDDEWEEIRNFMKSLTRLYHDQGREVLFYENAAAPQRRLHAALVAVPIPWDQGDTAPAFFREAMLSADEEWSQHKKIIDTGKRAREGLGRLAFRRSVAREMPYFHVWFNLDGGLGHIVEDPDRWPRGDLFAREIIGGMLDCEPDVIKKQGRWSRSDPRADDFKKRWRKFDWTRVLAEQ
jgi:hypothetical protein